MSVEQAGVERLGPRRWRVLGRDGRAYILRPLTPADAPALQRAFAENDPEDRVMRLLSRLPSLPDRMAVKFCTVDENRSVALAYEPEDRPGELAGGARLMRESDDSAEYAVSLGSRLKGQGLGRKALEIALEVGREMGVRHVWGIVSRRNASMRALAAKLGMTERPDPDDPALVITEIDLGAA